MPEVNGASQGWFHALTQVPLDKHQQNNVQASYLLSLRCCEIAGQ